MTADLPAGPELDRKVAEALGLIGHPMQACYAGYSTTFANHVTRPMIDYLTKDGAEFAAWMFKTGCNIEWGVVPGDVILEYGMGQVRSIAGTLPLALARLVVAVAEWRSKK